MDKTKFTERPGDSEGFVERSVVDLRPMFYDGTTVYVPAREFTANEKEFIAAHDRLHAEASGGLHGVDVKCNTCSPWALLDQDHLDRIHSIWVNSAEKYRQQLTDWYYEAQTEAKL